MKYTLTRIPVLAALLLVLLASIFITQSHTNPAFLTDETATSTLPYIEEETSTTTEPVATTTPDILTPELASSTASTTDTVATTEQATTTEQITEPTNTPQDTFTPNDTFFPRSVEDCVQGEGRVLFGNPGECLRILRSQ